MADTSFLEKYPTETEARKSAATNHPRREVTIVESMGQFYLEDADSGTFIRAFEREAYRGLGRNALAGNGRK